MKKWLLKLLLSKDEKYLLAKAVEDRINNLWNIKVGDRSANAESIEEDISSYLKMGRLFSTRDYAV